MILVLIFLGILVLLVTIITLIIASTLHIQIKNLSVSNMEPKNTNEYAIIFSLYLGNKIKWIWFRLNDKKVRKMYSKMQLEKLDFKKFRKDFKVKDLKELPKLQPKISYLNLDANLGVISPVTTSFLVATISSIISIALPYLATSLKKERYISLRCKDGYRGYVLLEKGRNYLLSEYEKELSFFISGSGQTGHVKSEPEKRMRLYRMSEVWVFFWKAGIEILRNHKPDMDKGFVRDRGKAFYYGSLEFKGMSEAIRGSRSCGVLLSGDTVLVVYNTMDRNMKWAKKMECSMRTWTERMLLKGGYNSRADALIVGQNIKVLLKLLESDGGIKKDLFRPDDIYDQYYYIPMCQEGILQIILLTEKQKREKLKQFLLSRFPIRKEKEYAVYAVCDEIGNPVYLGYDLEMRQLCRIKQELLWRPSVSIVCMDYQAEIIREYLGEKVIIYELNTENVMKYLINDIGE